MGASRSSRRRREGNAPAAVASNAGVADETRSRRGRDDGAWRRRSDSHRYAPLMDDEIQWLVPPISAPLSGAEHFVGMEETTVRDFWQFALGDLKMNNARGYLAEFIVDKALGIENLMRVEWDSYDLVFGDITIEIKSSAFLQLWAQKKVSALMFSGLQGTRYRPRALGNGEDPLGKRFNAMVYVLCAHEKICMRHMTSWTFCSGNSLWCPAARWPRLADKVEGLIGPADSRTVRRRWWTLPLLSPPQRLARSGMMMTSGGAAKPRRSTSALGWELSNY